MMLANKLITRSSLILRSCSYHAPAASLALGRVFSLGNNSTAGLQSFSNATKQAYPILKNYYNIRSQPSFLIPKSSIHRNRFGTQPIICRHDDIFANDLSMEEFDNAYKFLYEQHNHHRGPWVKVLQSAQHILSGQKSSKILVLASGPGEPATTLASNFTNSTIISAHVTEKCIGWAKQRLHQLALSNVVPKQIPDLQSLDFADSSFDLIVSGYGLANSPDPQGVLDEIHRVLKPGGSYLAYVWEQLPADPGSDIILRHACIGPNPLHKTEDNVDSVGRFRCPVRTKCPMSLSKPHLLETMIGNANLSVVDVSHDEYPIQLGDNKRKAFKALTLPIQSELQKLLAANHYHSSDAAEAFEDVLNEGFMVRQKETGEIEVPYNVYKFVVARRQFEDSDIKKELRSSNIDHSNWTSRKSIPIKPIDVRYDPIAFDTWVQMKAAASDKIVSALEKQLKLYRGRNNVNILDTSPSPNCGVSLALASDNPNVSIVAISRSANVVKRLSEQIENQGTKNIDVKELDPNHLHAFNDKTFDIIICDFDIAFLNLKEHALSELKRVLKPGGSLVISVWEDLVLSQLSNFIIDELKASGIIEDVTVYDTTNALNNLLLCTKPRILEDLIMSNGLSLIRVDHETAKIPLSDPKDLDLGINVATLLIRPLLQHLSSGRDEHAFENARHAFKKLLDDPSLVSHDKKGNATTTLPSRFKLVIATRPHEDGDGYLETEKIEQVSENRRKQIKFEDIPK